MEINPIAHLKRLRCYKRFFAATAKARYHNLKTGCSSSPNSEGFISLRFHAALLPRALAG